MDLKFSIKTVCNSFDSSDQYIVSSKNSRGRCDVITQRAAIDLRYISLTATISAPRLELNELYPDSVRISSSAPAYCLSFKQHHDSDIPTIVIRWDVESIHCDKNQLTVIFTSIVSMNFLPQFLSLFHFHISQCIL